MQRAYLYVAELHRAVSFEQQNGLYVDFINLQKAYGVFPGYMGIPKHIVREIKQFFCTNLLG